jgi:tRNA (guanine10-N2)-dimethyltransferase
MRVYIELSGEAPALGRAEAAAAAQALGGRAPPADPSAGPELVALDVPDRSTALALAGRIALGRRCLTLLSDPAGAIRAIRAEGAAGRSAAVRRLGRPTSGGADDEILRVGAAYVDGGGRIDLDHPDRRFWLDRSSRLLEELAGVDRSAPSTRRMPMLPFQRPVSLPPRLARCAANLARIRPGDRVVDPFVGTGALLAEAGLLGARTYGVDRDPEMVRGAVRNFAHLGVAAEELAVGDAGEVDVGRGTEFDAVLTDPPYGRSSSTGGEGGATLVARVLPRWARRVRPGGRIVVVLGGPAEPLPEEWRLELAVAVRVHRSLTREFRVYARHATGTGA